MNSAILILHKALRSVATSRLFRLNEAKQASPGQRPGFRRRERPALKGRHKSPELVSQIVSPLPQRCSGTRDKIGILQESIEGGEEFSSGGDEGDFEGFSGGAEALAEGFEDGVVTDGIEGRHGEGRGGGGE